MSKSITYNEEYGVWVSEDGKVFRESPQTNRGGNIVIKYKCVSTPKGRVDVHRLVALTFIPNPENKPCVCHANDNPSDNRVENLWWGTHKENMQDMIRKGRDGHCRTIRDVKKEQIELILERLLQGKSQRDIASELNVTESRISQLIRFMKDNKYLSSNK